MQQIDINCDMGEGTGLDEDIMPLISSCNIACGGHTGDRESIANTINSAIQYDVSIGVHPSYPDQENFGRKSIDIPPTALRLTLIDQIQFFLEEIERQQGILYHVKPHGALYNDLKNDQEKAEIMVSVINEIDPLLTLVVPPHSVVKEKAEDRGISIKIEGFADRRYESDFSLKGRNQPDAMLTDKEKVLKQVLDMALHQKIELEDGTVLKQAFDTICIHSDTENSLELLRYLNEQLALKKIRIQS